AGDRGGEHSRRPDQRTRQHRRRPHRPCLRHLLPHRRAQRHQERRPRGGGGRLGRAARTSELLESASCAEHQPGLVGRRASDRAQHHGRLHLLWGWRTLSSCTISGNTAMGWEYGSGGGVAVVGGTVTISSCTISGNT
ncbi:hypothetical protein Ctob_016296, partial [Chrysochromulina tobinii]